MNDQPYDEVLNDLLKWITKQCKKYTVYSQNELMSESRKLCKEFLTKYTGAKTQNFEQHPISLALNAMARDCVNRADQLVRITKSECEDYIGGDTPEGIDDRVIIVGHGARKRLGDCTLRDIEKWRDEDNKTFESERKCHSIRTDFREMVISKFRNRWKVRFQNL